MNKKLIIIPAYNEEENISSVINELRKDINNADILVINDCSTDNTVKILEEKGIKYLTTPFNLGYAGVVQTGFKYAEQHGYDYVAQFDGDGQHIASELDRMFKYIDNTNIDILMGSRFKEETEYNHSFFRKIGTGMFQKIIKMACKQEITDPTSGLQILSKRVYTKYARINGYPDYPDANLIMEMLLQGYIVEEISVEMRERTAGVSMHAGIWHPCKYMIKMFYSVFLNILKYRKYKGIEASVVQEETVNVNKIFFASTGILVMIYVYKKVAKKKILEKESFFWMLGAIMIFLLSLFPETIDFMAMKLNIYYAPSMLFMLGIIFTLLLVFRLTIYVSTLQNQVKELAQRNAILEKKIDELDYKEK